MTSTSPVTNVTSSPAVRIPWLSGAIGVLVYLITGSWVAALCVFIGLHLFLFFLITVLIGLLVTAAKK